MQVYYCCAFDLLHSTEGVFNLKQCCADLSLYHLKACRTVCSLALVVLGCHTPICLCSAPSGRTHLEIQMTTSWPQGPRRPPILPVGQTGTDIEGKAILHFNRPR